MLSDLQVELVQLREPIGDHPRGVFDHRAPRFGAIERRRPRALSIAEARAVQGEDHVAEPRRPGRSGG
jgi:hypothetical protein